MLEFDTLHASPGWRTYLALQATLLSLADSELRNRVQAALARPKQGRLPGRPGLETYGGQLASAGPESGVTFETLAALVNAPCGAWS